MILALHAERAKAAQQQGDFERLPKSGKPSRSSVRVVPEVYSNRGMMWHFAQDYPKAIAAFQQALRLNPKLTAPHLFLGIDYYLMSFPNKSAAGA